MKEESVTEQPGLADAVCKAMDEATAIYMNEEPDDSVHQGLRAGDLRRIGLFPQGAGPRRARRVRARSRGLPL